MWRSCNSDGREEVGKITARSTPPSSCLEKIGPRSNWRDGCKDLNRDLFERVIPVLKIGWLLAILCAACWWASEVRLPGEVQNVPAQDESVWRRTVDGWEKANDWTFAIDNSPPALHPSVLGLLMVTLSLSAGIAKR